MGRAIDGDDALVADQPQVLLQVGQFHLHDAVHPGAPGDLRHPLGQGVPAVVQHMIRPARPGMGGLVLRAHRGDDAGPAPLGQLHRIMPHHARPPGHQHPLSPHRAVGEDAAVGGHGGDAQAGPLGKVQPCGQGRHLPGRQGDALRRRAMGASESAVVHPDPVAGGKAPHAIPQGIHHTGAVAVRNLPRKGQLARGAGAVLHVGGIEPGGMQPHPHLPGARRVRRHLPHLHHLGRRAVAFIPGRFHAWALRVMPVFLVGLPPRQEERALVDWPICPRPCPSRQAPEEPSPGPRPGV